jgi:hypothetical protein
VSERRRLQVGDAGASERDSKYGIWSLGLAKTKNSRLLSEVRNSGLFMMIEGEGREVDDGGDLWSCYEG